MAAVRWTILVAAASALAVAPAASQWQDDLEQCEPMRVELCANLKYNSTKMPNFFNHRTQTEAFQEMQQYLPVASIVSNCSAHLRFFLCSLFYPMCTFQHGGVLIVEACRSMCMQIRKDCEQSLSALKISWPAALHCDRLPEYGAEGTVCMQPSRDPPGSDGSPPPGAGGGGSRGGGGAAVSSPPPGGGGGVPASTPKSGRAPTTGQPQQGVGSGGGGGGGGKTGAAPRVGSTPSYLSPAAMACPPRYVGVGENSSLPCGGEGACSPACQHCVPDCNYDVMFGKSDKDTAAVLVAVWSSVCMLSTFVTVCTFCVDPDRFKYPVRPVLFLALSYFLYAASYLIRLFSRPEEVICKRLSTGDHIMIVEGVDSTLCIMVFLVQYYFGMAGSTWWTILALSWFLAACRKWGQEAIKSQACYFHLAAWGLPAAQTIVILVMGRVDGQELTGTCYVGGHDRSALLAFVLVPLAAHLAIGTAFILAGFAALFRVRQRLKTAAAGCDIRKMEKLMAKIGVFAVLYTVPALCVIGCLSYEYTNMERWKCEARQLPRCDHATSAEDSDVGSMAEGGLVPEAEVTKTCSVHRSVPAVEIFIVKLLMSLTVGVTSCMWVLGPKSVASWLNFLGRCRSRKGATTASSAAAAAGRRVQQQPPRLPVATVVVTDKAGQRPPQCILPNGVASGSKAAAMGPVGMQL